MTISLWSTNGRQSSTPYKEALTVATPPNKWLWFRTPESIRASLSEASRDELVAKIKKALESEDLEKRRQIILSVFESLLASFQTGFTSDQVTRIVGNLSRFSSEMIVPIEQLWVASSDYLLNESTGPTDAFKDLALQMLTEMVSIITEEENTEAIRKAKLGEKWQTLKFVVTLTSTSGDTGPAGWSGIEGKDFIINVIWFPAKEATFSQAWQMMRLGKNVRAIPMSTSFSAIQDAMKAGNTADFQSAIKDVLEKELAAEIKQYGFHIQVDSGSFNSINPGRIDGQTLYHAYGMLQAQAKWIVRKDDELLEVVPSGNGGHVFGVLMGRVMSGQKGRTIITCNANDFFYKMVEEWVIAKPPSGSAVNSASISMIIEYPNNIWRFLAYMLWTTRSGEIEEAFNTWKKIHLTDEEQNKIQRHVSVKRIVQNQELITIGQVFKETGRLICPHTANAVAGLREYRASTHDTSPALISETASPWKFLAAAAAGLSFEETDDIDNLYATYRDLEKTKEWCAELLAIIALKFQKYGQSFRGDMLPDNLRAIYEGGFEMWEVRDPSKFHEETLRFLREYAGTLRWQVLRLINEA